MGELLGTGCNALLSTPNKAGARMVDHQKAAKQAVSGSHPDWGEIFRLKPELAPPGYEEACKQAKIYSSLKRAK